jgi:subfamily B ATP-binding cassette protein MsbA
MGTFWRLLGYIRPYMRRLVLAGVMLSISGVLMGIVVSLIKPLVNQVILKRPPDPTGGSAGPDLLVKIREWVPLEAIGEWARDHAFVQVPLILVAVFIIRGFFLYFGNYNTIKAGASLIRDLREELYASVAHQSLGFFVEHPTGTVITRILADVVRLQRVSTIVLSELFTAGSLVPILIIVAFYHDWRMSLVAMIALPMLGYPAVRLSRRMRRASTASQVHMALVANRLSESVAGVKVVQGFGMERYEIGRFRQAIAAMLRADLKAGRARSLATALLELIGAIVGAVLFYFAGLYISKGNLDPGNFTLVLFCLGMLFASFKRLNAFNAEIQIAMAAAERVFDMLDRERTIDDLPDAAPLPTFDREIRFDHVSFSYGDELVLNDIDLTIAKGHTVALVGPSGAGKTTLASLLPRFYDPTAGRILIDGHDIRKATLASLRGQIGLVTQETVLFDDSVRKNIAYGREDIELDRVVQVAKAAQAHEFIENLPSGYDTTLGERGTRLSMGQRQRLTIARALLKDPPILILDEATSALDTESEALVQQALETLMRGRTSIVIAHRLATVRSADRILVLDRGRIVEDGSHTELLAAGGAYKRLYDMQFREEDE